MNLLRRVGPALAVAALLATAAGADPAAKSIKWMTSLKKAQAQAARLKLPIMIDLYSVP